MKRSRGTVAVCAVVLAMLLAGLAPAGASRQAVADTAVAGHHEGSLANGTTWIADVPEGWNGTILLFSHGYLPSFIGAPNLASNSPSPDVAAALLDRGYALVGSSYAAAGWALPTAPQDQFDSLAAAIEQIGQEPDRILAYGQSMGGLVTAKMVETEGSGIDGALAMCGIVGGGLALNNYQLDGAHAIDQLLAPDTSIQVAQFATLGDAFAASGQMVEALNAAQASEEGRARIALVAALYQVSDRVADQDPPGRNDWDAMEENQYQNLLGILPFVVPGRVDISAAAGGNAEWNTGVDYRRVLSRSADRRQVAALYRRAGLDLSADLRRLTETADVEGDSDAIESLVDTSVPTGSIDVPVLTLHTVADSLVPVEHEAGYARRVRRSGSGRYLRQAFADHVGHCTFTTAEIVAAVQTLDARVDSGRWGRSATPAALQRTAEATGIGPAAFVRSPARLSFLGDRQPPASGHPPCHRRHVRPGRPGHGPTGCR